MKQQMKQERNLMNEEAKRHEKGFAKERRMAAREGYLHGISTVYPYTIESAYKDDEYRGRIFAAKNQDVVATIFNEFGVIREDMIKGNSALVNNLPII